jgi:cell division protein ZipA
MMQANWSLILNVLLLIGVIGAIGRLMSLKKRDSRSENYQPDLNKVEKTPYNSQSFNDDIIAVRKVNIDKIPPVEQELESLQLKSLVPRTMQPQLIPQEETFVVKQEIKSTVTTELKVDAPATLMLFLLAKENRQFAGYELLQTVLAAGLRFGEGHLFHRHQLANGQGSILCSLAAATASGVFDLQNIGAFSVRGLCLFMQVSTKPDINAERFSAMLKTARQLSDGMDAHILDAQRKPLNAEQISRYCEQLKIPEEEYDLAMADE